MSWVVILESSLTTKWVLMDSLLANMAQIEEKFPKEIIIFGFVLKNFNISQNGKMRLLNFGDVLRRGDITWTRGESVGRRMPVLCLSSRKTLIELFSE